VSLEKALQTLAKWLFIKKLLPGEAALKQAIDGRFRALKRNHWVLQNLRKKPDFVIIMIAHTKKTAAIF